MKLFTTFERTYMGYRENDESSYAYLNRTARPEFAAARGILEEWFAAYPQDQQANLASNFTSDNYGSHLGAFFELYIFSLLRACDFEVHVEQVVDANKGNPIDFVAGSVQNPDFCVESTVVADAELTVKSRQQLDAVATHLNRIPANRRLLLEVLATSKTQLRHAEISADVKRWLDTLDTSAGTAAPMADSDVDEDFDLEPSHDWVRDGWLLRFKLLPGARVGDLIAMQSEADWVGAMSRLKGTLQEKADQHGGVEVPYIVAVNVVGTESIFRSEEAIMEDLFGKLVILIDPGTGQVAGVKRSPELPGRSDREKGFWYGRSGPRNQHVSGVLLVNEVMPWSVMEQTPVLLHNPWARKPISREVWPGPQMVATDTTMGTYEREEGETISEILSRGR